MTTTAPLDELFDVDPSLAGIVAGVAVGNRRDAVLTPEQVQTYRAHVVAGTTGTRLWTDPTVGTYVIQDET